MFKRRYIVFIIISVISVFFICAGWGNLTNSLHKNKDALIEITVPDTPNPHPLLGIGVQFDPFFHSVNVPMDNGAKETDWDDVICPRVESMKIQRYRVGVLPHWWEPYNDNDDPLVMDDFAFTWDNEDMKSLYKVLDLAEKTGADVNLVLWGCPRNASLSMGKKGVKYLGRYFMADNGSHWVTGPINPDEFAENFTALLKHLLIDKGYTCIKEITPYNEPDGRVLSIDNYVLCFKSLDSYLRRAGLRNKVSIIASDNIGQNVYFLKECAERLAKEADIFSSHTYNFGYNSKNEDVFNWEKNNYKIISSTGKPHFIGEFGSNEVDGVSRQKDIDEYKRGVLLCRLVIDFLNAGAVSVSYWTLFDHFREMTNSPKDMQQLGLWRYVKKVYDKESYETPSVDDYYVRPQYYAFSLLTRFIRKGDFVYPLDLHNDYCVGTALLHKDYKWSYIFSNSSKNMQSIRLQTYRHTGRKVKIFEYRNNKLPQKGKQISYSYRIKDSKDGTYDFVVPSNSFLVINE